MVSDTWGWGGGGGGNMCTEQIHTLGFPPLESREASLQITAGIDFFGGGVLSSEEIVSCCATFV